LSLTSLSSLGGAPLLDKLLTLPEDIRLGCKGLPGTNTLAYFKLRRKKFLKLALGRSNIMKKCCMGFVPVVEYLQMKRSSKNIISILVSRLLVERHFTDRHLVKA
jgi:hypothetical protein